MKIFVVVVVVVIRTKGIQDMENMNQSPMLSLGFTKLGKAWEVT